MTTNNGTKVVIHRLNRKENRKLRPRRMVFTKAPWKYFTPRILLKKAVTITQKNKQTQLVHEYNLYCHVCGDSFTLSESIVDPEKMKNHVEMHKQEYQNKRERVLDDVVGSVSTFFSSTEPIHGMNLYKNEEEFFLNGRKVKF